MSLPLRVLAAPAIVLAGLAAGCAQVGSLIPAGMDAYNKLAPTRAGPAPASDPADTIADLKASPEAEQELLPDRTCSRPLEKFDIADKAQEYAGTAAQLRLQHLVQGDSQFSNLTAEDKKFLRYLAVTTVWVPLPLETAVARAYEATFGKPARLKARQVAAKNEVETRLRLFQSQVTGFPGDVRLEVDNDLSDGVYAQLGARITTSPTFLGLMNENLAARDFVLSHEMSHVYKRHRLKELQIRLVSSASGFELAKKLMGFSLVQATNNPAAMIAFVTTTAPALVDFMQKNDLSFTKDQELEADACAAVWMERAHIDRCTAWLGFVEIAPRDGDYATTHPTTAERQANFYRKIDGEACTVAAAAVTAVSAVPAGTARPAARSEAMPASSPARTIKKP